MTQEQNPGMPQEVKVGLNQVDAALQASMPEWLRETGNETPEAQRQIEAAMQQVRANMDQLDQIEGWHKVLAFVRGLSQGDFINLMSKVVSEEAQSGRPTSFRSDLLTTAGIIAGHISEGKPAGMTRKPSAEPTGPIPPDAMTEQPS